jgi:hypothetical protein
MDIFMYVDCTAECYRCDSSQLRVFNFNKTQRCHSRINTERYHMLDVTMQYLRFAIAFALLRRNVISWQLLSPAETNRPSGCLRVPGCRPLERFQLCSLHFIKAKFWSVYNMSPFMVISKVGLLWIKRPKTSRYKQGVMTTAMEQSGHDLF